MPNSHRSKTFSGYQVQLIHINGTVYGRLAGSQQVPLFWLEGYNINRKIPQQNGNWMSLSREFLVYRDFHTRQILEVFINPFTAKPNEVFHIVNDHVSGQISEKFKIPSVVIPGNIVAFNADYILQYPNPLDPDVYPKFSAGSSYKGTELVFCKSIRTCQHEKKTSIDSVTTWSRHSQFLPWFEMGQTRGSMFYSAFAWQCVNGIQCVNRDILRLIKQTYKKFLKAPDKYEEPEDTTWTIDQRRMLNLTDINLPAVNRSIPTSYYSHTDPRIIRLLSKSAYQISFHASLMTQIVGVKSLKLLNMKGSLTLKSICILYGIYQLTVTGTASYLDR